MTKDTANWQSVRTPWNHASFKTDPLFQAKHLVHHPSHHLDLTAAGCRPGLAPQSQLGLRSQRPARSGRGDPASAAVDGPPVIGNEPTVNFYEELCMTHMNRIARSFMLIVAVAVGFTCVGCDNKETLMDVDTPDGGVEVERDRDDGSISIDVDD